MRAMTMTCSYYAVYLVAAIVTFLHVAILTYAI